MKSLHQLLLLLPLVAACGSGLEGDDDATTIACSEQSAQIAVHDSFLEVFCGCEEPANSVAVPPASLTCTVPAGATVVFSFVGVTLKHQIEPSDAAMSFTSSPLFNPKSGDEEEERPTRSHTVRFDAAGTYGFRDAFMNDLAGQILVR